MRRSPNRNDLVPPWLTLFLMVLRHRPRQALDVVYCRLRGRRVRARNRLRAAGATLPDSYRFWIETTERQDFAALANSAAERALAPTVSVVIDAASWTDHTTLADTLQSIRAQSDPGFQLIVVGEEAGQLKDGERYLIGTVRDALAATDGGFTIIVPPDALLPPWAIGRYREAALVAPDATILFGDEDAVDATGRRQRPWLKPQWNAELILASDYLSRACAVATPALRRAAREVPATTADLRYALVLAAATQPDAVIRHIPHILCHLPLSAPTTTVEDRVRVVAHHLTDTHAMATVGPFDTVRVRWPLPITVPSVTIIVPTRDRVELMKACVGSLLRETDYADYDILIVDNGSVEPETRAWFAAVSADPRVSVLPYDRPYNYSAINNFAAMQARGQYLCLLNNDTEVIDGAWLSELMRYAVRPHVGAVGAKLLYPDRSIQHAGVVMGMGNAAGHAHRTLPDDEPGYFALAHTPHEASAVTAACLVVERAKFDAVGGLDADHLQIAYNDVDFCLKLAQAGWRNIYAPQAILIHHESKSRGQDLSPRHIERYTRELATLQERWDTTRVIDRMHHPRLDRASETYRLQVEGSF